MGSRNRASVFAALALAVATHAGAREVAGVNLPETVETAGTTLRLNGAGVRTRFFFKVYVAALYLQHPTRNAEEVIESSGVRRMDLHMLRALDGPEIASAIGDAFARNSRDQLPSLRVRLDAFEKMFPAVNAGDTIIFTIVPGKTIVAVAGREQGTIPGDDFAAALLRVWLGPSPVDEDLKRALLGG